MYTIKVIAKWWTYIYGVLIAALFVALSPLLNLYAVSFSASTASEAEDDVFRELEGPLSDGAPSDNQRTFLIRAMGAAVGLIFVPLCLWFFTLHWPTLWGPERSFWFQNGFWLTVAATLAAFLTIPKYFPEFAKSIGQLERAIGKFFQES